MPEYRFTCPNCGACTTVDGGVRERLLVVGCPVCAGPVDAPAFVEIPAHNDA
jgi:predicted nucleic acid-binding Zn ribbon protein